MENVDTDSSWNPLVTLKATSVENADKCHQSQVPPGDKCGDSNVDPVVEIAAEPELGKYIHTWCERLHNATKQVGKKSSSQEPYKFIYQALKDTKALRQEVQAYYDVTTNPDVALSFWINVVLIHIYSSIAKWSEACDQLAEADQEHKLCIKLIEKLLESESIILQDNMDVTTFSELQYGILRVRYMLIYELTRYAILCSERDDQEKALNLLTRAETFYHTNGGLDTVDISPSSWPLLSELDSLNPEKSVDMFVYVLFYLAQAYRITDNKERALLYLHMVLRKQLDNKSSSIITWSADTVKMATAVLINIQSFDACKNLLVAATTVLQDAPEEMKSTDDFKQTWADLGKAWMKLGLEVLESSCDRLKDLEEQTRKPPKFSPTLKFTHYERLSLGLDLDNDEYDTLLLIRSLNFPSLDVTEAVRNEIPVRFARDFEEARAIFLPLQRWFRISKEYYFIDEYASDYIELATDYAVSYKYLVFFEANIGRQIKMQKRRITVLEDLLKSLSSVAYHDVFHYTLKDLAEIYENIYKLKVSKAKDRGEPLQPKDKKLVKLLSEAVNAHRRNLDTFQFNVNDAQKEFPEAYEKALLGTVLSIGRILGSMSHDHPFHPDAIKFAEDGKAYYEYFLKYLDRHPSLKTDFKVLYDGSIDLPELLDRQIARIKSRLRLLHIG